MAKVITDNQYYADIAAAIRAKNKEETLYKPSEMAAAIAALAGGAALNVTAVSDASALPETADENTIAVVTGVEIGAVYARNSAPTTASAGDVFIKTDAKASFVVELANEGSIQICISCAYVYTGSAWETAQAFIFQGGEWAEMAGAVYLYYCGDECTDHSGGWETYVWYTATADKGADGIRLVGGNTGYQYAFACTKTKVDVTDYSTIHFEGTVNEAFSNGMLMCGIQTAVPSEYNQTTFRTSVSATGAGEFHLLLDVSEYSGEFYVCAASGHDSTVTAIYMEE